MYCNNCGEKIDNMLKYCPICGAKTSRMEQLEAKQNATTFKVNNGSAKEISNKILFAGGVIILTVLIMMSILVGHRKYDFSSVQVGDYIQFGKYEQDNNKKNGAEDLQWLVLDKTQDKILVISRDIIDCQPYMFMEVGEEKEFDYNKLTWETCTLRDWLNNEFYNSAFGLKEKKSISITSNNNPDYDYDLQQIKNDSDGTDNDTKDKVFVLSFLESEKYCDSNDNMDYSVSEYTLEQTANWYLKYAIDYCNSWDEYKEKLGNDYTDEELKEYLMDEFRKTPDYYGWWLRTLDVTHNYALCAGYDKLDGYLWGGYAVHGGDDLMGVRPALWIYVD